MNVRYGWKADIRSGMVGRVKIIRQIAGVGLLLALLGFATATLATQDSLLTEDQIVDLMENPDRWIGRTVTLRIYPYDNGFTESYVACLEPCDAAGADRSVFLIYTGQGRFDRYRGDRPEIVRAVFRKICPDDMPVCLDAPTRIFALDEVH